MSGYPKTVKTFIPWTKAMVAGATLDKPSYPGTKKRNTRSSKTAKRRRRRRKKKANA